MDGFNVDYEMCGKDLTESVDLASKICGIMKKQASSKFNL